MPTSELKIAIPHVSSRVFKNGESYMVRENENHSTSGLY